jgi:hypothetical protein
MNRCKTLHFAAGLVDEAGELVKRHHYSRRIPSNVQAVGTWHDAGGLFGDRGDAVAACFFAIPPTRWSESVLELARLVRRPDCTAPLSQLVSLTTDHLRRKKLVDLVVSFADWKQGHHGGIYQAAGWSYAGQRSPASDGVIVDGTFVPGRSANSRWGTRSPEKLRQILGADHVVEVSMDIGKHLYWRALNRFGKIKAERLGLVQCPYPKPNATSPEDAPETIGCETGATPVGCSTIARAA